MKFFFQCTIILLVILIILFLYNKYFASKNELNKKEILNIEKNNMIVDDNKESNIVNKKNNFIKNLKYEIKLSDNSKYLINSNLSELTYSSENEIIYMTNVEAEYVDKKNISFKIKADTAIYNSSNNNTNFKKNIIITFLDNTIFAEKVDLDFFQNNILIYENVLFKNPRGIIKTDNINMDLITKNISMFMNKSKNKVQVKLN